MIYKDITKETARIICKRARKQCEKCPLRRTRKETDEKGNEREIIQFCTFVLLQYYDENQQEEMDTLLYQEIEHADELQKWISNLESQE